MILDVIFSIFLIIAFYFGWKKGALHSIISLVAIVAAIMIAIHFSFILSIYLDQYFTVSPYVLPVISFILVFLTVLLVVRLCVFLLEKILKSVSLNFINKCIGGIFWVGSVTLLSSVLLWLIDQAGFFSDQLRAESMTYEYIVPIGPLVFDYMYKLLPFFQETFQEMNDYFRQASESYR